MTALERVRKAEKLPGDYQEDRANCDPVIENLVKTASHLQDERVLGLRKVLYDGTGVSREYESRISRQRSNECWRGHIWGHRSQKWCRGGGGAAHVPHARLWAPHLSRTGNI